MRVAIIGVGFVGNAVARAFANCELLLVDPKLGNSIEALADFEPQFSFVCVPTPSDDAGRVDTSIVKEVVTYILRNTYSTVIVKSTVPPSFAHYYRNRIVINPEFLTERNAIVDLISAPRIVLGGDSVLVDRVKNLYISHSECWATDFVHVSAEEACWIKYITNTFLAVKVAYLNELRQAVDDPDAWTRIVRTLRLDDRLGTSHWIVPGIDGKLGFGGACFPKDSKALLHEAKNLSILNTVIESNNKIRSIYELDSREREQNIKYDN
jgi:UDPglucose 6-dehydrogenase